jgi:hypothetical protein
MKQNDRAGEFTNAHGRNYVCVHNFNPEFQGKRTCGRLKDIWEDNIKIDLNVLVWKGVDCT